MERGVSALLILAGMVSAASAAVGTVDTGVTTDYAAGDLANWSALENSGTQASSIDTNAGVAAPEPFSGR
jgi:hypothetical protein